MINAILGIICIGAIAAFLVMWSKWEKEKEKRWDEISRAEGLENIIEDRTKDVIHYSDMCDEQRQCILHLQTRNIDLQDKVSSVYCPHNDHVWEESNGVKRCKKCGRAYNG